MWRAGESIRDYLARNEEIRESSGRLIDILLSRVPEEHKNDICGRLESSKKENARSAIFEMLLFRLLENSGLSVEWASPSGSGSVPDFWLSCGEEQMAVEAKVVYNDIFANDYELLDEMLRKLKFDGDGWEFVVEHCVQGQGGSPSNACLKSAICGNAAQEPGCYTLEITGWEIQISVRKHDGPARYAGKAFSGKRDPSSRRVAEMIKEARRQHSNIRGRLIPAVSLFENTNPVYREFWNALLVDDWPGEINGVIAFGSCYPWVVLLDGQPNLTLWCRPGLSVTEVCPGWVFDSVVCRDVKGEPEYVQGVHYTKHL